MSTREASAWSRSVAVLTDVERSCQRAFAIGPDDRILIEAVGLRYDTTCSRNGTIMTGRVTASQRVGGAANGGEMTARERLLDLLARHSYQYETQPVFKLTSGRMSNFYINCKPTTMRRDAGQLIAKVFEPHLPASAKAVGGLTLGADPIAYALRDLCALPLEAFVVRKSPKEHGLRQTIEGPISHGMRVVVVDDVVTTGGSTITAIEACRENGLEVVGVIVLVDRLEDGGLDRIRSAAAGVPVHAVFTRDELHARWLALRAHAAEPSAGSRTTGSEARKP